MLHCKLYNPPLKPKQTLKNKKKNKTKQKNIIHNHM